MAPIMKPWASGLAMAVVLACLFQAAATATEPGAVVPKDVVLSCDFDDAQWWRAWGLKRAPASTALGAGKAAFGGQGKSPLVTLPRGPNTGANFHFRVLQQRGRGAA